jgi:hypothetical protein
MTFQISGEIIRHEDRYVVGENCVPACLRVCLSLCLSACLPACLRVCLSCLPVYLYLHISITLRVQDVPEIYGETIRHGDRYVVGENLL